MSGGRVDGVNKFNAPTVESVFRALRSVANEYKVFVDDEVVVVGVIIERVVVRVVIYGRQFGVE